MFRMFICFGNGCFDLEIPGGFRRTPRGQAFDS